MTISMVALAPYMSLVDPQTQQPIIPPTAIQRMLYYIFKNAGISTDGIFPDFDLQSDVLQDVPQLSQMVSGATIDGRNPAAGQAIANSNGPMGSPQPGALG